MTSSVLQFKFSLGSARGFNLAAFDWQETEFSKAFHLQGVKNVEDFLKCLSSLCISHSLNISVQSESTLTPISSVTPRSTATITQSSVSTNSTTPTASRKRKADSSETPHRSLPPALRPLRIISQPEALEGRDVQGPPVIDEDIQKSFVGAYQMFTVTSILCMNLFVISFQHAL